METLSSPESSRPKLAGEIYDRSALEARAWQLINSRQRIEHDHWQMEPEINARTAIFEELTAQGHLSQIEFEGSPDLINEQTLRRLLNGWSENLPDEEKQRRFLEIVEELTNHQVWEDIKAGRLPSDTLVTTVSNYPEMLDDEAAVMIGYRALNKKGMVRTTSFEGGVRTVEQISRSNSNDGSAERFFGANGFVVGRGSARILSSQIIATKQEFPDGVIDVQRGLDGFAGPNVIYGEDRFAARLNVPEYEDLREVSAAREKQAESFIKKLAAYERLIDLEYKQGKMTYDQKLGAIYRQRKDIVDQICLLDPSYARDARGEEAARHYRQASMAMAMGNDAAGIQHLENAHATTDPNAAVVCGGNGSAATAETGSSTRAKSNYEAAKQERKNWKWSTGMCVVEACPTRPDKIQVGPCSVCEKCQEIFDRKGDPATEYGSVGIIDFIMHSIEEIGQESKAKYEQQKAIELARQKAREAQEQQAA